MFMYAPILFVILKAISNKTYKLFAIFIVYPRLIRALFKVSQFKKNPINNICSG